MTRSLSLNTGLTVRPLAISRRSASVVVTRGDTGRPSAAARSTRRCHTGRTLASSQTNGAQEPTSRVGWAVSSVRSGCSTSGAVGVGEEPAVASVEVALRRQPLGQQDGVLVQLHVVVIHRRPVALPADGGAVHQLPGADQHAVHQDRVVGRDQQIAVRHAVGDGVAFDADRRHGLRPQMRGQIDAAMAEPRDGLRDLLAIDQGNDLLARSQLLDRQFAVRRPDHRAARVAGNKGADA